jgi:hypothetical protein
MQSEIFKAMELYELFQGGPGRNFFSMKIDQQLKWISFAKALEEKQKRENNATIGI